MGNCASPLYTRKAVLTFDYYVQSTAMIVHIDGRLQVFKQPIKASHILCQNPDFFLCSSESMYINSHVPHVPGDEELQLGQIYFLLPLSRSQVLLSLQELCALAIKASAALAQAESDYWSDKTTTYLYGNNGAKMVASSRRFCKIPSKFDMVGGMGQPAN